MWQAVTVGEKGQLWLLWELQLVGFSARPSCCQGAPGGRGAKVRRGRAPGVTCCSSPPVLQRAGMLLQHGAHGAAPHSSGDLLGYGRDQFPEPAPSHQPSVQQPIPNVRRETSHTNFFPDCFKLSVTQNKKRFGWGWKHKGPMEVPICFPGSCPAGASASGRAARRGPKQPGGCSCSSALPQHTLPTLAVSSPGR